MGAPIGAALVENQWGLFELAPMEFGAFLEHGVGGLGHVVCLKNPAMLPQIDILKGWLENDQPDRPEPSPRIPSLTSVASSPSPSLSPSRSLWWIRCGVEEILMDRSPCYPILG